MAQLLARVRAEVCVDHRSFDLLDDGGPQEATPVFDDPTRWLFTGRNAVTVVTPDSDTEAAEATVELWDGEPPAAQDQEKTAEALLRLDSGLLEVNPLVEDDPAYLDLRGPGTYHLRVHATGERYVFRLWA